MISLVGRINPVEEKPEPHIIAAEILQFSEG